jgi:hypothetical protein
MLPRIGLSGLVDGDARVASEPQVRTADGGSGVGVLRSLALLLVVLVVVTTPSVISLVIVVLVVVLAWRLVARWLGIGASGSGVGRAVVGAGAVAAVRRSGPRQAGGRPALTFRTEDAAGRVDHVDLVGHDAGIALGDTVRISGWRIRGRLHARSVRNLTTGVVFRRPGLVEVPFLLVVVTLLGMVLVDRLLRWT